jgi:hypothetical protein
MRIGLAFTSEPCGYFAPKNDSSSGSIGGIEHDFSGIDIEFMPKRKGSCKALRGDIPFGHDALFTKALVNPKF